MATIKSYTDIEQSKVLAEILPLESTDMYYPIEGASPKFGVALTISTNIPCWSLASLLKYLSEIKPKVYTPVLFPSEGKWILQFVEYGHGNVCEIISETPINACYEIILELHELNLL